jgi:nicotinamide mononucleotide transporter
MLVGLEIAGATTAILYLLLVTRRTWLAWPFYILSSAMYIPVFWMSQLYSDAVLQVFFIAMGAWGWCSWREQGEGVELVRWRPKQHLLPLVSICIGTSVIGGFVFLHTQVGYVAFADAFLLVGSIVTTVMTVGRVVQNWWYWIVINLASVLLYGAEGIWITSCLAVLYLGLSIRGLLVWSRESAGGHIVKRVE